LEENINKIDLKMEDIQPIKVVEEQNIKKALIVCNGNAEEAAKILGISRATIYRKISKYKIKID
jgi:transcriptional regulator of acetoin/glycerol metabolism